MKLFPIILISTKRTFEMYKTPSHAQKYLTLARKAILYAIGRYAFRVRTANIRYSQHTE